MHLTPSEAALLAVKLLLTAAVLLGSLPLLVSLMQFSVIGFHRYRSHYPEIVAHLPKVSIVVPAWNEAAVIGTTIDRLMALDYPDDALRVYVVDDASTDGTPEAVKAKEFEYPGKVFHLRREKGGQGKAHTLNHGIAIILKEPWTEALMIIDADVLFEDNALRKMARHLSDERVGAVTAYIKEGSVPGNLMTRFIAFEYITAQAASRRAQNVFGGLACMAGGAQLHSRVNLEAIGGRIDTSSLAEDTFTTFNTQLAGRRALFDGNATVWAEEPGDILGLWKQRLRWARGNVQVTRHFRWLWFNRRKHKDLGGVTFGLMWFSILLMPAFMIGASIGLLALYFIDFPLSWFLFRQLWILNALTYLFVTFFSFAIDPVIARRSWVEGVLFPGLISLAAMVYSCVPKLFERDLVGLLGRWGVHPGALTAAVLILFLYAWTGSSMAFAYLAKWIERKPPWGRLSLPLLVVAGYGPLLCAIGMAAFVSEYKKAEMKWDKTEKSGKVQVG